MGAQEYAGNDEMWLKLHCLIREGGTLDEITERIISEGWRIEQRKAVRAVADERVAPASPVPRAVLDIDFYDYKPSKQTQE